MSEHIDKAQLKNYGLRELAASDAVAVIRHFSRCRACLKEYQTMFPEITSPSQIVAFPLGKTGGEEPFHLDFNEHLCAYVDDEIGDVDREIVEGHVKSCGHCAAMLRDLQEFRERLDADRGTAVGDDAGLWHRMTSFLRVNAGGLAFAAVLLTLISAGAAYWFNTRIPAEVAGPLEDSPIPPVVESIEQNGVADVPVDDGEKPQEAAIQRDAVLAGLSGNERRLVERTIAANRIQFPGFLSALSVSAESLRGGSPAELRKATPSGVVLRARRPEFSWGDKAGETYIVEIYDENFTRIHSSPAISSNRWKPEKDLPHGKVIQWQVKSNATIVARGAFFVLSVETLRQIAAVERDPAVSDLARGIVYANAGLLPEAKASLRKYISSNPGSKLAADLLGQISRAQ